MTAPRQPEPEPPAPPGEPDREVDLPIGTDDAREVPENEDVEPDAGAPEPPD
jgi:hypothetical protein